MFKRIAALSVTAIAAVAFSAPANAAPTTPAKYSHLHAGMTKHRVHEVLGARPRAIASGWSTGYGEQDVKLYRVKGGKQLVAVAYLKPKGAHHFYLTRAYLCTIATWTCETLTGA